MRRWVDRFSVNTEPCLGLGLFEAVVPFSALITATWRAWMYIFLSGCVLHSTQDMAAGIHEEGWSWIDEDGKLWRRTKKLDGKRRWRIWRSFWKKLRNSMRKDQKIYY
jgi:hypothetical protein